nr:hypothetical protein [Candidatus Gracilibacteria bacterium]
MNNLHIIEKGPYLAPAPKNLQIGRTQTPIQEIKSGIEKGLKGNNEAFEEIKVVLNDGKISFNGGGGASGPIWIGWEIKTLNKDELTEICYRVKDAIQNRNPRHDTDIYPQITKAIEERLNLLGITYNMVNVKYNDMGHTKSIKIPMPI